MNIIHALRSRAIQLSIIYTACKVGRAGDMDNSEDDRPMYVPARRSYEIVQYPARSGFPWGRVILGVVIGGVILIAVRFLVIDMVLSDYLKVGHKAVRQMLAFDHRIQLREHAMQNTPPPLVGPYHLPLSTQYRLAGKIQGEYMATSLAGAYVLIPPANCQVVNGGPFCEYHGYTVTRSSGG